MAYDIEIGGGDQVVFIGQAVSYSDGVTPVTDLSLAGAGVWSRLRTPDGSLQSLSNATVTHVGSGFFNLTLSGGWVTGGLASGQGAGMGSIAISAPTKYLYLKEHLKFKSTNVVDSETGADRLETDPYEEPVGGHDTNNTGGEMFRDIWAEACGDATVSGDQVTYADVVSASNRFSLSGVATSRTRTEL